MVLVKGEWFDLYVIAGLIAVAVYNTRDPSTAVITKPISLPSFTA